MIEIRSKLLNVVVLSLLITSCDADKNLCNEPVFTNGDNLIVLNHQCVSLGSKVVNFIEIENKSTRKRYIYTVNVISGKLILNLSSAQMIAIDNAESANMLAASSAALAVSSRR